jgi:hypothetical protein
MSTISSNVNYAVILGIHSLAGPIVFDILYVFLLAFFIRKSFTHPTYVHYILTLFCAIRVAAFTVRAVLAGSKTAGQSLGLVIADEVLSQVGYFSLLYSAYTLVLDRTLLSELRPADHPILKFTQDRRLFRLLLMVGVALGIVAATRTTSSGPSNTTSTRALRITSATIFLVLTLVQALQTGILATSSISGRSQYYVRGKDSIGIRYGNYILLIISFLLIIREIFTIATVTNSSKQYNEHFWYPFVALPEILSVILYTTPGLVPRRDELPQYSLADTAHVKTPYATSTSYAEPVAPYSGTTNYAK